MLVQGLHEEILTSQIASLTEPRKFQMEPEHNATAVNEDTLLEDARFMEILEHIEKRPLMYLGRKSLIQLSAFLTGYDIGSKTHTNGVGGHEFCQWLSNKFGLPDGRGWVTIMEFEFHEEENAFDNFLPLFKEYLRFKLEAESVRSPVDR
ncbi:MAG: hypothetical protein ABWY78_22160 [Microvirga sp.]